MNKGKRNLCDRIVAAQVPTILDGCLGTEQLDSEMVNSIIRAVPNKVKHPRTLATVKDHLQQRMSSQSVEDK